MKRFFYTSIFAVVFSLLLITACKKENKGVGPANNGNSNTPCSNYTFKNQNLSGKIGGNNWTCAQGIFRKSSFDSTKFSVYLSSKIYSDSCWNHSGTFVMGSIKNAIGLIHLGNYDNITLYDSISSINYIASCGAIEVVTADTVAGIFSIKVDARLNDDNYLNGNFTLKICQ